MTARLVGEQQLRRRLEAVSRQGKPIMSRIGLRAVGEQKRLVPRRTGNLGRTIHLASVTARSVTTEATAPYARPVEFGTRPHIIRARKGRALRFPASGVPTTLAGRVRTGAARSLGTAAFVFRAVVHHPGTRAHPFMEPGARKAADASGIKDLIVQAWNDAA